MAMTIEELNEKLELEIAARKLLERQIASQNNSIIGMETRLDSRIQTVSSELGSRMQNTEGLVTSESAERSNEDQTIRSSVATNASAIAEETSARALADDALRQAIQAAAEASTINAERIENCELREDENAEAISAEALARQEGHESLSRIVSETQLSLEQKMLNLNTVIDELQIKAQSMVASLNAETENRVATDDKVSANEESIKGTQQEIDSVKNEITEMNSRFMEEAAVSNMISDTLTESFASQTQNIYEILDEDRSAREVDIANIQDYAGRAQNALLKVQESLSGCRQEVNDAVVKMRNSFNMLLPIGTIMPYGGDLNAIPEGWRLCNGANGTPDLVGKVLVGAAATAESESEYVFGSEGGEKEVLLTAENMPAHYHFTGTIDKTNKGSVFINGFEKEDDAAFEDIPKHKDLWGTRSWNGYKEATYIHSAASIKDSAVNMVTSDQVTDGSAKPHNNMQPYYCIYYIMKMF